MGGIVVRPQVGLRGKASSGVFGSTIEVRSGMNR